MKAILNFLHKKSGNRHRHLKFCIQFYEFHRLSEVPGLNYEEVTDFYFLG